MEKKIIKWTAEEKIELQRLCESEWEYNFPGYKWVADRLNSEFNNNRTAVSCRNMDKRLVC